MTDWKQKSSSMDSNHPVPPVGYPHVPMSTKLHVKRRKSSRENRSKRRIQTARLAQIKKDQVQRRLDLPWIKDRF